MKILASRGHSFRGTGKQFQCSINGNFLMLLEYLSESDPFIREHICKYVIKIVKIQVIYITLFTKNLLKVMSVKIKEIKIAKYYSIIVDLILDISHVDKLSFILRYVNLDGTVVKCLLENLGHKDKDMYEAVKFTLKFYKTDILDLRSQSYDNATNMRSIYSGL